jgi:hypothetical protein
MSRANDFWDSPFDDSDYFTGPTLTDAMIRDAEVKLGYSECGRAGEPRVIHVETETAGAPEVLILAPDFECFLAGLREHGDF